MNAQRKAGLTSDDLHSLSAGLDAGKRVTVYLRDPIPALGIDAGTSARVISVDGTTVTVRPKGVDDQLPFEADELLLHRPSASTSTRSRASKATTAAPAPSASPRATPKAVASEPPTKPAPTDRPATTAPDRSPAAATTSTKPKPAPAKSTRRGKSTQAPVSVTVTSAGESTWTVTVSHGSKKGKATEVTADRVARAMRELGDETAIAAVDDVIETARVAAQQKIDELTRELERAKAALAHLDAGTGEN